MIANSTTFRLKFFLSQRWDSDILSNSYMKVSYTFTRIGFIAESTLKNNWKATLKRSELSSKAVYAHTIIQNERYLWKGPNTDD